MAAVRSALAKVDGVKPADVSFDTLAVFLALPSSLNIKNVVQPQQMKEARGLDSGAHLECAPLFCQPIPCTENRPDGGPVQVVGVPDINLHVLRSAAETLLKRFFEVIHITAVDLPCAPEHCPV